MQAFQGLEPAYRRALLEDRVARIRSLLADTGQSREGRLNAISSTVPKQARESFTFSIGPKSGDQSAIQTLRFDCGGVVRSEGLGRPPQQGPAPPVPNTESLLAEGKTQMTGQQLMERGLLVNLLAGLKLLGSRISAGKATPNWD